MASSSGKAKLVEVPDDHEQTGSESDASEEENLGDHTLPEASAPSTSSKKKKKKRSKAVKALNALRGGKDHVPQQLVDAVLDKVKETGQVPEANEETVRAALEQMKIKDVIQGKAGVGGINKKDVGSHKFWGTQPVPQIGDELPESDGYIEPSKPSSEVRQEPFQLQHQFEWSDLDVADDAQLRELYELLSANYIEDDDAEFRFQYSAEFLRWALKPPGYHKAWHVGVRVASNKKLVAFISAVPITLRVRENTLNASEVNFLCIHKKLRSKRLAPVLIKEVTRRCNIKGVFQALYTAGILLPTPVATCKYHHRCLNVPKLVNVQFTHVPSNMTLARMIRLNKVPERPKLLAQGLREMEEKDVPEVTKLYGKYMQRFGMSINLNEDEVRHNFLSGRGDGPGSPDSWKRPREGQVVWTYVVEDPSSHKITDFWSFYSLPSTIMTSITHNLLNAAYLYYYATDVAFQPDAENDGSLKKRLEELVNDALVVADQGKFDVFNALTLMDNVQFLNDLRFGAGSGLLNYYVYNWRTTPLAGLMPVDGVPAGKGIGVVML
ncbi:N-myristoyl transferase [Trametopsis cervina]|nr:N-myristoyl transferase [Trametopsis cervina]